MVDDSKSWDRLKARLNHLEKVNRWTVQSLTMLSTLEHYHLSSRIIEKKEGIKGIIRDTRRHLSRLLPFEVMAFFVVDEKDQSFDIMDCEPASAEHEIFLEKDRLIDNGTFPWSLYQFHPVMVPGKYFDNQVLLHVISTKSRTRGLFLGILGDHDHAFFDSSLNLLSIALMNCANVLESFEHFNMVQQQNISLEEAVEKRTHELRLARDQAEAANQAKSGFLSNMSHELRSPLNAIMGFSEVLLMHSQDPDVSKFVPKIKDAGRYLTRLIEELLDFDRIETGKVRLDLKLASPNEIVASAVEVRLIQLPKGFSLECSLDPNCGEITCDPVRIRQVVLNLLDNAIKFSPQGGTIRVHTESHPMEVRVSIQDEGIGINSNDQKKIFDRFHQVEEGLRRQTGGLGVGLSLVKQILTLHGGRIWLTSEEGKGSTFTFSLPVAARQEEISAASETFISPTDEESKDPWFGLKILIADDLEDYHLLMGMLMSQASEILPAYNGEEAIKIAQRERPDLIIMDLRMPILDGFEAIREIKRDPETRDIPLLGVSAQAMSEDRDNCLSAGADGFVTKPIDMDVLRRETSRVLALK